MRAKAAGLVRDDFASPDIHLAARMIAAGAQWDQTSGFARAVDLIVRGLKPSADAP